ncbi:MAG TPA: 3-keto-5-aminohexanoate cleavage protein [Steroidobacteraceae bacterium]|nr:3-keto-5-aminohexanoate cleavage protein [Steroidobacteraceae bacterium]HRX88101.1 3-keto-5-aminohexanoate cleavage protein [Steroidobacteraceae bacterium]
MSARAGLLLTVAPNGARRTQTDHPALPITTEEIAVCAAACHAAGAAMIHLHVRDGDGRHSLDPDRYLDATAAVRQRTHDRMTVQITSEAAGVYAPREQMRCILTVKPEAASVAMRELCPDSTAEAAYGAFLERCAADAIWVQHILYSPAEIRRFGALHRAGVIPEQHPFVLLVVGSYRGDQPSTVAEFGRYAVAAAEVPDCEWAVCAFGSAEHVVLRHAAAHGFHLRTGFENNLLLPDGTPARDNAELVACLANALRADSIPLTDSVGSRSRTARRGRGV